VAPLPSERLDPPLIDFYVKGGYREARSKINKPEARAIISEIARITKDPCFKSRTIGVVSLLGFEQARYIQNLLLSELGEDTIISHDIKCGDSKHRTVASIDIAEPGQNQPDETEYPYKDEPDLGQEEKSQVQPITVQNDESENFIPLESDDNGNRTDSYVQINDTVTYAYLDNPENVKMVQIIHGAASVSDGIIGDTSPIGLTLLGGFVGEKLTACLPTGAKELEILNIIKS
jgi:transcription elongation GreA/GreB family factor